MHGVLLTAALLSWMDALGSSAFCATRSLELTRAEAERDALANSSVLKAYVESTHAAQEQAQAQYALLFPDLTFDASYQYIGVIPNVNAPSLNFQFGAHNNYSIGPTLRYTLWDTYSRSDSYHAQERLAQSRDENRKTEELQLQLSVRNAYVHVQESLEELRLVFDSLELARSQNRDIRARRQAGASSRLDVLDSNRDVLSYEMQFAQKQTELTAALKDLLALTRDRPLDGLSRPGPASVPDITLEVHVDPLAQSLREEMGWKVSAPDDTHPQILSQELAAQSSELQAKSQWARLYPTVGFQFRSSVDYPNGPVIETIYQNVVGVTLSLPLFEMDRTRHFTAQRYREADTARFQKDQTKTDMQRDFDKARETYDSLLQQQQLAAEDVRLSSDVARLYYEQFKAGKIFLTDVQAANNRALQSKVNAARIDSQILNQIDLMMALSGKKTSL